MKLFYIPLLMLSMSLHAAQEPLESATDSRVKMVAYQKGQVYEITAHTGISTTIEFAADEQYVTHQGGFLAAWDLVPNGNLVTLKPKVKQGDSNVVIVTNKRKYIFAIKARDPNHFGIDDPRLTFYMEFAYPEETTEQAVSRHHAAIHQSQTLCDEQKPLDPNTLNFQYVMAGEASIAPLVAFDDGQFTYLKIDPKAPIPAVYSADAKRNERVMNTRIQGQYLVVEEVIDRITLRHGDQVVSVKASDQHPRFAKRNRVQKRDYAPW